MFSRFDRYIARQVIVATLAVLLVLTAAIWLSQSLRFIDLTVNRGLPISTFISISALVLPNFLTVILPIALFAAVLFTYNGLQSDSELLAMRAVGLGPTQLMRPAVIVMGMALVIGYGLTLYGLPASYRAFKDMQASLRSNFAAVLLQEGVFTQLDEKLTLFVREQGTQGDLFGIMVHDGRNPLRPATYIADRGTIVQSPDGPRLIMVSGNRQELDRETGRVSFLFFDRYTVDIDRVTGQVGPRQREGTERYLDELLWPEDGLDERTRRGLFIEAHQRLAAPLMIPAFLAIAFGALLSGDFNRRGQTRRIFMAVLLAALTQAGFFALSTVASRMSGAVILLYLLPALIILAAGVLIARPSLLFPQPEAR